MPIIFYCEGSIVPTDDSPPASQADLELEIAHILLIDIVGYSKLLANEQVESIQELSRVVRSTDCFYKLLEHYPPTHEIVVYEAPLFPGCPPTITRSAWHNSPPYPSPQDPRCMFRLRARQTPITVFCLTYPRTADGTVAAERDVGRLAKVICVELFFAILPRFSGTGVGRTQRLSAAATKWRDQMREIPVIRG